MIFIESPKNHRIKFLIELANKKKEREQCEKFTVEGTQEIHLALKSGYRMETLFFCDEVAEADWKKLFFEQSPEVVKVSKQVFNKIAYRNSTGGFVALFHLPDFRLNEFTPPENPLILIAESLEKPGNIGALLRTADAAGVDAVMIADPLADFFNPNTIRSSVGTVFTTNVFMASVPEIVAWLKKHKITMYGATLQNSNYYTKEDYTKPTAIIVGTESNGLSEEFRSKCDKSILIPMFGTIDSMNVSVSAGILVYEAVRQRRKL
jgi:TrmH family RNA methyltransferase